MLGGESIPDHLKLEAGRQKHLAEDIGSPLCFAFRDELRKLEVGLVKANPPGWRSERHVTFYKRDQLRDTSRDIATKNLEAAIANQPPKGKRW